MTSTSQFANTFSILASKLRTMKNLSTVSWDLTIFSLDSIRVTISKECEVSESGILVIVRSLWCFE